MSEFTQLPLRVFLSCLLLVSLMAAPIDTRAEALSGSGSTLYATHCADCHHQLNRTDINDRPAKRIRSAINIFPVMSSLRSLSDAEVAAIAAALATTPAPVTQR